MLREKFTLVYVDSGIFDGLTVPKVIHESETTHRRSAEVYITKVIRPIRLANIQ